MNYADEIKYYNLNEMTPPEYWFTVIYGETGKRKTTTACSMIKESGLLVFADKSWKVLKKPIHKELIDKVTLMPYEGLSQFRYIDYSGYDHIILDTHTAMVDRYLDMLYEKAKWGGRHRETIISDDPELKGTTTLGFPDYRVTRDKWRPIIERLTEVPAHKIFLMHPNSPPIPGLSKDPTRRPRLPDATWQVVAEFADIIGYIEGKEKRGFTINVDESSMACVGKSRMAGIEGKMDLERFVQTYKENI